MYFVKSEALFRGFMANHSGDSAAERKNRGGGDGTTDTTQFSAAVSQNTYLTHSTIWPHLKELLGTGAPEERICTTSHRMDAHCQSPPTKITFISYHFPLLLAFKNRKTHKTEAWPDLSSLLTCE